MLVIHSESTEKEGLFHEWKNSRERKSYLIRLTRKINLFFFPIIIISLFLLEYSSSCDFSRQHNWIWTSLQHYNNLGQTVLHRLCSFAKCQERFGQNSWSKNDSNYLDDELKMFKREKMQKLDWDKTLQW